MSSGVEENCIWNVVMNQFWDIKRLWNPNKQLHVQQGTGVLLMARDGPQLAVSWNVNVWHAAAGAQQSRIRTQTHTAWTLWRAFSTIMRGILLFAQAHRTTESRISEFNYDNCWSQWARKSRHVLPSRASTTGIMGLNPTRGCFFRCCVVLYHQTNVSSWAAP
jgi:hypothetical protein